MRAQVTVSWRSYLKEADETNVSASPGIGLIKAPRRGVTSSDRPRVFMSTHRKRPPVTSTRPRLVLTGERLNRRHLVKLDDREIWVPGGLFATLCTLVHARCTTQTGFVVESPLTIFRLRELLDGYRVKANGKSLIETGEGQEYRLALATTFIDVDQAFTELPSPKLIKIEEKSELLKLRGPNPREIELKSV